MSLPLVPNGSDAFSLDLQLTGSDQQITLCLNAQNALTCTIENIVYTLTLQTDDLGGKKFILLDERKLTPLLKDISRIEFNNRVINERDLEIIIISTYRHTHGQYPRVKAVFALVDPLIKAFLPAHLKGHPNAVQIAYARWREAQEAKARGTHTQHQAIAYADTTQTAYTPVREAQNTQPQYQTAELAERGNDVARQPKVLAAHC